MNARNLAGFFAGLFVVGLLVGVGVGVYQMGVAQGIVDAGRFPAGATVPVAGYGYGWHGGFGIFGLLFGLFFLFLIFGLVRAAFFRGRGWRGGYGRGGFGPDYGPEGGPSAWRAERERHVAEWHRKLHEDDAGRGPGPTSS